VSSEALFSRIEEYTNADWERGVFNSLADGNMEACETILLMWAVRDPNACEAFVASARLSLALARFQKGLSPLAGFGPEEGP
jgi:hypothetical protein